MSGEDVEVAIVGGISLRFSQLNLSVYCLLCSIVINLVT